MVDALKNFAYSTVFFAPSPALSGPTLTVQPGDGAKFPTAPFDVTLYAVGTQPLSHNAEIARCTAVGNATLTTALTSGTAYTSLAVTALLGAVAIGDPVYIVSGANTQQFVASVAAAVGATTISVNSLAANFSYPIGASVDPDMMILNRAQYGTTAQSVGVTWAVDNAVTANLLTQISAGGVSPATTVTGPDAFGAAAVVGVGTTFARADHDHGLPAAPAVPAAATTVTGPDAYGAAAVVGVGTEYARSDHDHGLSFTTMSGVRITKRVLAFATNAATYSVDTDNYDVVHITAQTATITSIATTGTPVDGDTLRISITGTAAVPFTLAAANFEAGASALPTTTTGTARLDAAFFWNTETGKWRCMAAG